MSIKIAPSVLSADFTKLGEEVRTVAQYDVHQIHIDVMDGHFVPNISMGSMIVEAIHRITDLPLDVHLMITEPEFHIEAFVKAGAQILTVHLEACPHLHRTLHQIRRLGIKAGVAINPHTPASMLSEVLSLVDNIIVMTVNPGFGGQTLIPETLHKVFTLRQMLRGQSVDITVDGGIDATTTPKALKAGANVLVAGSAIFEASGGIASGVRAIQTAIEKFQTI